MGQTIAEAWLEEGAKRGLIEGAARQTRKMIVKSAKKVLGEPDQDVVAVLEKISDVERLERIYDRIGEAKSWAELLQTP